MSEQRPPEQSSEATAQTPAGRKRGSGWMVIGLLVLLGGSFVVSQVLSYTGPPIGWKYDLQEAEQAARAAGRRIFLLLHEPGCEVTAAVERDLFSKRKVRERLTKMVCCRLELKPLDRLRRRFGIEQTPVMLVLKPGRAAPLGRLEGKVDWRQFSTHVDPGLSDERD